jgi:hypothetical protein
VAARSQPVAAPTEAADNAQHPVRTRPWCPYPKKLRYVGGDVNTGSFGCE